jgi:hypothetical protein
MSQTVNRLIENKNTWQNKNNKKAAKGQDLFSHLSFYQKGMSYVPPQTRLMRVDTTTLKTKSTTLWSSTTTSKEDMEVTFV